MFIRDDFCGEVHSVKGVTGNHSERLDLRSGRKTRQCRGLAGRHWQPSLNVQQVDNFASNVRMCMASKVTEVVECQLFGHDKTIRCFCNELDVYQRLEFALKAMAAFMPVFIRSGRRKDLAGSNTITVSSDISVMCKEFCHHSMKR